MSGTVNRREITCDTKRQVDEDAWGFNARAPVDREKMVLRLNRGERTAEIGFAWSAEVAMFRFGWSDESAGREVTASLESGSFVDGLTYVLVGERVGIWLTHAEMIQEAVRIVREAVDPGVR